MKGTNKLELSKETVDEIFQAWADATFGAGKVRVGNIDHGYFGTRLTLRDAKEVDTAPIEAAA